MDRLVGALQHYPWGSTTDIPALLGVAATGEPQAELWFGTHPRGPASVLHDGRAQPLGELLARHPEQLGPNRHELPFLAKVLAADQPLSIQTHPDRAQAEAGFDREERDGVAIDAYERSFRDRNPKPELICALTDFEALCGFRDPADSADALHAIGCDHLDPVVGALRGNGPPEVRARAGLARLLGLGDGPAREVAAAAAAANPLSARLATHHPGDIGVVVALLLNQVEMQPGDALFLDAGNLHSYLRGVGVELMVSSDNVVRGGLTTKHVDRTTLLDMVVTTPAPAAVQRPDQPVFWYDVPVADFALARIDRARTDIDIHDRPAIGITTAGEVTLTCGDETLLLTRGQAAWVPAAPDVLRVHADGGQLHLATIGERAVP